MIYKIKRTDIFNDQLNSIIFYIADDSGDVDVALNILNRIEEDIMKLQEFPERDRRWSSSTGRKKQSADSVYQ